MYGSGSQFQNYAGSTSSTNLPSQMYDMSQPRGNLIDLYGSQKRSIPMPNPSSGETSKADQRAKSERFFKELQSLLSNQLDRLRDEIIGDLQNFKDVDEGIKRGLGLDVSALTDEIGSLKDDIKGVVSSFTNDVQEKLKEQDGEVNKVFSKLSLLEKRYKNSKVASSKSFEDTLSNTFQFLTNEVAVLNKQIGELKSQMKEDTMFAIERIKDVKTKYLEAFSIQAQRQDMINDKFMQFFNKDKKRSVLGQATKPPLSVLVPEIPFIRSVSASLKISTSQETRLNPSKAAQVSQPPSLHEEDIQAQPKDSPAPVVVVRKVRGRPKKIRPEILFVPETPNGDNISSGANSQATPEPKATQKSLLRSSLPRVDSHLDTSECSVNSDGQAPGTETSQSFAKNKRGRKAVPLIPIGAFQEVCGKFDYLRKNQEELELLEKQTKKRNRGKGKSQIPTKPLTPREERLARRREQLQAMAKAARELKSGSQTKTIINKVEHAAKEKAVQQYGEKSAKVITQASNLVKTAERGVGKMRGRIISTAQLNNV